MERWCKAFLLMPEIMTNTMLKIAVDVGSSENRTLDCTDFGEKKKLVNSNNYIRVSEDADYKREMKYEKKLLFSEKLHLKIAKLEEKGNECDNKVANKIVEELQNGSFLIGAATKFERVGNSEKMLPQQFKHQQISYYLNVIAGITMVMDERGVDNTSIRLKTLFPPNELTPDNARETEDIAKGVLCGNYKVTNLLTGQIFEFSIDDEDYEALEEMKMALARLLMTESIKLDDDNDDDVDIEEVINENTLLFIDIGNSTTNLSIFEDGKYQPQSNETFTQLNGNVLLQYIGNAIKQEFSSIPEITLKDSIKALETGKIKIGRGKKDVKEAVQKAITKFSNELYTKIRMDYFANKGIASYNIAYLLVSGGGSVAPDGVNNSAKELHSFFQKEEALEEEGIGLLIVDIDPEDEEDEDAPVESVRDLNVNGAGDFFDLETYEEQEQELEPQVKE